MPGKSIGYIRVSTVDQNTERQLADVQLDKVFEDKVSGSTIDRPQLKACLDYLRDGDDLWVHSIDRLARNLQDLLNIIALLGEKGVTLHFKKEGMVFGMAAKMFTIAGPVIVYGVSASVFYGIIYWVATLF